MNKYSRVGLTRFNELDPKLQILLSVVLINRDHSILCAHRGEVEQNAAVAAGTSTVVFPNSKHNSFPSKAVDIQQYPYKNDVQGLYMFIGYVQRVAEELNIKIRCGADWDSDGQTRDQTFHDVFHIELVE